MQSPGSGVRRRNETSKKVETKDEVVEDASEEKSVRSRMVVQLRRLCTPYKLLILFTLIVFTLQILVGISFFHTFSHRFNPKPAPDAAPATPSPKAAPGSEQSQAALSSRHNVSFPCNISAKEPLSAIQRASSLACKQRIADLVCSIERGEVYPATLPRYCQSKVDKDRAGEHEGCYKDSFQERLLQGDMVKFREDNNPTRCVDHCLRSGFIFAGLQYGVECFCGNHLPGDKSKKLGAGKCDMPCPGAPELTCGGYLTMDIHQTGFVPLVPSKLGEVTGDGSSGGKPVKIVYLLTIAGRASRQVARLVRQIYSPDHYILVHVDSRQEYMYREVGRLAAVLPNLRLASSRHSTIWGGASLLTMLLDSARELLEMEDWSDWDFLLNLSESDYPVKTQQELVEFLTNNRESNFVKGHGREQDKFIKKQGLDKTFYECDTHMWRLGPRTLPQGVQIDGGSDWICLNRQFAKYVVYSEDELVTGLKTVFSYTLLPAESFFHTVLRNSAHCHSYIDNNLHLTNWKRKQGCKCQYKHIVDWCGCSPNDFLPEDWAKLEGTRARQIFFARKFEPIVHHGVVNRVEEWSKNATIEESATKHSYWQNIYHSHDTRHDLDPSPLLPLLGEAVSQKTGGKLAIDTLRTLTVFSHNNVHEATLALVEAVDHYSGDRSEIEIRFKYVPRQKFNPEYQARISAAGVGANFDPKELIFRNYVHLMGQEAKISARFHFATEQSEPKEQIHFGWFDPKRRLVAKNTLEFNKTSLIEGATPSKLNVPLQAGVWTVVAMYKNDYLFSEQFLVASSNDDQKKIAQNDPLQGEDGFKKLNVRHGKHIFEEIFFKNHKPLSLLKMFFHIDDVCIKEAADNLDLTLCEQSSWSTLFSDPKSEILGVNPETGQLI